jgi:putative ATP-binding cassette transporter
MVVWTSAAALLSGACNTLLLVLITSAMNRHGNLGTALIVAFCALGLGRFLTNALAQVTLAHFSQATTARLRLDLVSKILAVPLRQIEELGAPKLMVALTEDILEITQATLSIPIFAQNFAVLLGGAVYLAWLSFPVFLGMFAFGVVGAVTYRLLIRSGFGHLSAARDGQDRLFQHFRSLTEGIKELKLHRARREAFLKEDVAQAAAVCQKHNVAAELRFIIAQNWNQLLFLALIGLILFLLPHRGERQPAGDDRIHHRDRLPDGAAGGPAREPFGVQPGQRLAAGRWSSSDSRFPASRTDNERRRRSQFASEPFESLELVGRGAPLLPGAGGRQLHARADRSGLNPASWCS